MIRLRQTRHALVAVLIVFAAACEFFRGTRREVPVNSVPEECVRQSLARVPEISSVREWSSPTRKGFSWEARRDTLRTQGSVALDRQRERNVLELIGGALYLYGRPP
jgi:hypothetical protein